MSVVGIFRTPVASGPMEEVTTATLISGKGLEGDRYCDNQGTYSLFRISKLKPGEREPGRQLTLLSADSVEAALERNKLQKPKSLGDLRRNVVLRGLSAKDLLDAAGHVVRIGSSCQILIHRNCVPCIYNERKNGIKGLVEAIWNEAGVSCEVLQGGSITVGDVVEILEETQQIDDGNQAPGFYIPPSKRTSDMVSGSLKEKQKARKELVELDPEGVERIQASYGMVGLKFWPRDK